MMMAEVKTSSSAPSTPVVKSYTTNQKSSTGSSSNIKINIRSTMDNNRPPSARNNNNNDNTRSGGDGGNKMFSKMKSDSDLGSQQQQQQSQNKQQQQSQNKQQQQQNKKRKLNNNYHHNQDGDQSSLNYNGLPSSQPQMIGPRLTGQPIYEFPPQDSSTQTFTGLIIYI